MMDNLTTKTAKSAAFGLALLGLFWCGDAGAQITLHDGSTDLVTTANTTSISKTLTVTSGARVLVVSLFDRNGKSGNVSPASLTWDAGNAQTLTRAVSVNNAASTYADCNIYYVWNPNPGTATITATDTSGSTPSAMTMQAYTLGGVDANAAPVTYTANNRSATSLAVALAPNTPAWAWAVVNSSYGTGNDTLYVASSSGVVSCPEVLNITSQSMGYVANLGPGSSTITANAGSGAGAQKMALGVIVFTPLISGPAAPINLVATGQTNQVALSWNDASGGAATNYIVLRSTTSATAYTPIATNTSNSATTYIDTSVTAWTTYYYVVRAVGASGTSVYSIQASATPLGMPAAPTGLTAAGRNLRVVLSWNAQVSATNFNVLRSMTSGSGFSTIASVTTTNYTDYPLVNGTTYYYKVNATNSIGTSSDSVQVSAIPTSFIDTNSYPPIAEIRTASDTVLAVYLNSTNLSGPVWNTVFSTNEVDTSDPTVWLLNGEPVSAIDKFVAEADGVDYHIYLHVPKLANGMSYTLVTPHGMRTFVFDDTRIPCESIKVNQSGYSALSHTRYANLAVWLGTGGAQPISGPLPTYTVLKQFTGQPVATGTVQAFGGGAQDASSGDYVYRIDLSNVPEGGPYKVSLSGYGCSYPFGVGGDFSRRLAYVAFRSLYYQRCGVPLVPPYAWTNIRPYPCHTNVYDTQAGFNSVPSNPGTAPALLVHGGYHDAGDSDRNAWHLMVPMVLLTTYEVFPNLFTDDQFNIPDLFDANFNVLGKGNGVPDILDEALWGAMIWTNLQSTSREPLGAVGWGVNAPNNANPAWGINWDQDTLLYGTATNDVNSCGLAAGVFMNLARLMQPYNAALSEDLQSRADAAYTYAGTRGTLKNSHKLYYSIQKYLLTGDVAASNNIRTLYGNVNNMVNSYNNEAGGYLTDGGMWLASYFMSYIIATNRPTDPTIVSALKGYLKAAADNQLNWNSSCAYPVGWPASVSVASHNFNQGGLTTQGQLAYPCLMQWALTGQQQYIDAVSQLMDYNQGLNPLGKCYMTGIGLDGVQHPHTRETAYCQVTMGWGGPLAGITVYGPVEPAKLSSSPGSVQVPPLSGLARERCYVDHLGFWAMDEFTVYQSEVFPAAVYAVLAQGGKWNTANEPFLNPSACIQAAGNSLTVTFGGLPARKSYVQASSNVAGPWSDISGPLLPDASGSIQFTATAAAGTQFYRTRWSAPLY